MPRRFLTIVIVLGAVGLLAAGAVAAYVLRPPATPSGEITAIPVAAASNTPAPIVAAETATEEPTPQLAIAPAGFIVAELVQAETEARFLIDEILNGSPFKVVGVTNQVAAQILIDPNNPANVQLGPVTVNARTFVTDSGNRNRAIQNEILDTAEFEFVTFTPKTFIGLPATGAVGDTFSFQILGDLTVRNVTQEVTFDLTVTIESDQRLSGFARTMVSREQFDLGVIRLPFSVAEVSDPFTLELDFVAEAVQ
jgi:polyisoprenoid-binding protein YceI